MSRIHVVTLGGLRIETDAGPVEALASQPVRSALLLYLAVERTCTRDEVTALLWPDRTTDRARHSLSQTLYELRRTLGSDCIDGNGERLDISPTVTVDALEFVRCIDAGRDDDALRLFRGPFLAGVHLAASVPFDTWIEQRRSRMKRQFQGACRRLCDRHVRAGELDAAIDIAARWTDTDPLDDEAHHRLIELLAAAGRRVDAIRTYDDYERRLAEELDIEPLDETRQLVARLRAAPDAAGAMSPAPDTVGAIAKLEASRRAAEPATLEHTTRSAGTTSHGSGDVDAHDVKKPRAVLMAALLGVVAIAWIATSRDTSDAPDRHARPVEVAGGLLVLPFASLSSDPEQAYFAEGVAEDLLATLARIEGLRVIARTSAWQYRDSGLTPVGIARELGVDWILTGSVRREDGRVRVTAHLVDARTEAQVWTYAYDRELSGIFELQEDIAARIAAALTPRLAGRGRTRLTPGGTTDVVAYDLFLRGREYLNRPGEGDVRKFGPAMDLFGQALAADPSFGRAYVGMSEAFRSHVGLPLTMRRDSALHYARLAIRTDPGLADAAAALGWGFLIASRRDSAEVALDRALRLDPNHAAALAGRARLEWVRGRIDEAVRWQQRALAIDPAAPGLVTTLAGFLLDIGDLAGAETAARRAVRLAPDAPVASWLLAQIHLIRDQPDAADSVMRALATAAAGHPGADFLSARYHAQRGRLELAAGLLARAATLLAGVPSTLSLQQAYVAKELGDAARAEELLDSAEAGMARREAEGFVSPRLRAQLAALRGDSHLAIAIIRRQWQEPGGVDHPAGPQLGSYWLDRDPLLQTLRSDPAFTALLHEIRAGLDAARGRLAVPDAAR